MSKIFLTYILLLFTCIHIAIAQVDVTRDELPNTNSVDSTAVLNNVLRQNQNAINSIGGYFNSNNYLSESNGGTGSNLSLSPNGSILVQDLGNVGIGTFTQGTSGQALISQGANSVPTWGGTLYGVSNTTFSGVATSGNISITNGKNYFVKFNLSSLSGTDKIILIFNADSGSHYSYSSNITSVTANQAGGSLSDSKILLSDSTILNGSSAGIQGSFYIQQLGTSSQIYYVWGQQEEQQSDGSPAVETFGGQWSNSANVTSFSLLTLGGSTMTGTINVYQVS